MLKRVLAIMLTGMLLTMALGFGPVKAQSPLDEARDAVPDDPGAAKVRLDVLKMGVGEQARVEVRLRDNSNLKGYIGEATEGSFTVVSSKDWSNHRVAYPEVQKVKKAGNGFFTFWTSG